MSILSASRRRIVEATLPEKRAVAACLLVGLAACSSDHHVSAWGGAGANQLGAFLEAPDLDARLALVDTETAAHGLHLTREIPVTLPRGGGPVRIRGYEGADALGRPVHAIRVATARAVVMALGPLDPRDAGRDVATELVPALLVEDGGRGGAAFRSGTDLTGDGALSVVARSETGALAIWRVTTLGAAPYPVTIQVAPTRGLDADGDGRVDLAGDLPIDRGDAIAPRLADVATFDGAGFSDRTDGARAFHAALIGSAAPAKSDAPPSDEVRLRRAVERAWHAVLAGRSKEDALKELQREPVPARLRASFDRHVGVISSLPGAPASGTPDGR
jgi:hypothetical protein